MLDFSTAADTTVFLWSTVTVDPLHSSTTKNASLTSTPLYSRTLPSPHPLTRLASAHPTSAGHAWRDRYSIVDTLTSQTWHAHACRTWLIIVHWCRPLLISGIDVGLDSLEFICVGHESSECLVAHWCRTWLIRVHWCGPWIIRMPSCTLVSDLTR